MPSNNTEKPLTIEAIKNAILLPVASLFEYHSAKVDERFKQTDQKIDGIQTSLDRKINGVKTSVEQKIHESRILMEQMDKKIDLSLEFAQTTSENKITIKEHSKKIEKLEVEVNVIKQVLRKN